MNYHDPCDWNGGTCVRMRSVEGDKGCCEGCEHLGPKGCAVKSLYCKLWLCDNEPRVFKECKTELKILSQVAKYCGIPCEWRKSEEENFELLPEDSNNLDQ